MGWGKEKEAWHASGLGDSANRANLDDKTQVAVKTRKAKASGGGAPSTPLSHPSTTNLLTRN